MEQTDPENPERPRGILSPRDRRYLLGESDTEPETQKERNIRATIRERLRHAIMDFVLLYESLDERDCRQVLRPSESNIDDGDPIYEGVVHAFALLYTQDPMRFKIWIEEAVETAMYDQGRLVEATAAIQTDREVPLSVVESHNETLVEGLVDLVEKEETAAEHSPTERAELIKKLYTIFQENPELHLMLEEGKDE